MLVGGDDHRGDFRPCQQFPVIGGDKVSPDLVGDEFRPVRLDLGNGR